MLMLIVRESGASLGQTGYALARKRLRNSLSMRVSDNDDGMASGSEVVGRPRPRRLVIACSMAIAKLPQSTFGLVGWALIISSTSIDIKFLNIMLVGER